MSLTKAHPLNNKLIFNRHWLQDVIQRTEGELLLLHHLQEDITRLQTVLPDASNVSCLIRETVRLEESLRITLSALQKFTDTTDRNNAKAIAEYEDAEDLAMHIFD